MKLERICTRRLWTEVFAEFLITTLFISFVCGCSLAWNPPSSVMHMAISSGLGVATFAFTMWDVSSGLFNPALTIGFLVGGKKTFVQTLLYIVAQLAGSVCGAAMVYGVAPNKAITDSNLAVNLRNPDVNIWQAFGVEIWITFILVLVVFSVGDPERKLSGYGPPLAIGFYVFVGINFSIPLSGGGMNPARSFGPAVIMNSWQDHWIYWAGPIIGAVAAAVLYRYVFSQKILQKYQAPDDRYDEGLPTVIQLNTYPI
ncbi:aquaporin [Exaiptasia diaphana]|uniref:Aquaporin n=1 Tax=Exaiptasia diaphana TaxID=2652724 RepID=A0A913WWP7_EXADI|nr:aquaporin [Exaiptasia diaphana]XP_020895251.1 aquaporin [Exaiptasia diaphana]KXJ05558.1 Aquaporin [Exaiptasia diaphana]